MKWLQRIILYFKLNKNYDKKTNYKIRYDTNMIRKYYNQKINE